MGDTLRPVCTIFDHSFELVVSLIMCSDATCFLLQSHIHTVLMHTLNSVHPCSTVMQGYNMHAA